MSVVYVLMVMLLINSELGMTADNNYFAFSGEDVTLQCPGNNSMLIAWYGPPNYMPYSDKTDVNPAIKNSRRITVTGQDKGECSLSISNVVVTDGGEYRCRVLKDIPEQYDITLFVFNGIKPAVFIEVIYAEDDVKLECRTVGPRQRYRFVLWEHLSDLGDHIRYIPAVKTGKLIISRKNAQNSGIYKCIVYYLLPGNDDNHILKAETNITIDDKPKFATGNEVIQSLTKCGKGSISTLVYSFPKVTKVSCTRIGQIHTRTGNDISFTVEDSVVYEILYGVKVRMHGYRVTCTVPTQEILTSSNYSVRVENVYGMSNITVSVTMTDCLRDRQPMILLISVCSGLSCVLLVIFVVVVCWKINNSKSKHRSISDVRVLSNGNIAQTQEDQVSSYEVTNEYEEINSINELPHIETPMSYVDAVRSQNTQDVAIILTLTDNNRGNINCTSSQDALDTLHNQNSQKTNTLLDFKTISEQILECDFRGTNFLTEINSDMFSSESETSSLSNAGVSDDYLNPYQTLNHSGERIHTDNVDDYDQIYK